MKSLIAPIAAACLGYLAWLEPHSLLLLLLFPFLFASGNRREAVLSALAYYLSFARDIPVAVARFFPDWPVWAGYALWLADAALLAMSFLLVSGTGLRRVGGFAVAVALSLVPPLAFFAWGSPLFVAGELFPGQGYAGIALTLALLTVMLGTTQDGRWLAPAIVLFALSALVNFRYAEPGPPAGWVGLATHEPRMPSPDQVTERTARTSRLFVQVRQAIEGGASVVIMPESIVGEWRPAVELRASRLMPLLRQTGATALVGADLPLVDGLRANSWILVDAQGMRPFMESRIPMPAGDWKFGLAPGARANPWASDLVVVQGRKVAASICYEDYILWPHSGVLSGKAEIMVSTANEWSIAGHGATHIQSTARRALARLAGVPHIEAVNL